MSKTGSGWYNHNREHSLAARGIKTRYTNPKTPVINPDPYGISNHFSETVEPEESGWILTDGRKIDTGPHHMNVSSVLPQTDRMKYLVEVDDLPQDERNELWEAEWEQISSWQNETGTLRYEYVPQVGKIRVISGLRRPTNEQLESIAKSIRELNPQSVHFIKTDEMFNDDASTVLGEYESDNPRLLDVQMWVNKCWIR